MARLTFLPPDVNAGVRNHTEEKPEETNKDAVGQPVAQVRKVDAPKQIEDRVAEMLAACQVYAPQLTRIAIHQNTGVPSVPTEVNARPHAVGVRAVVCDVSHAVRAADCEVI
ncbi:MAG TPA: hypothetical protein VMS18_15145 [Candidatus Binatia bacterium]|nr:hypothetical protein [Candidatus Binatia bacterium]